MVSPPSVTIYVRFSLLEQRQRPRVSHLILATTTTCIVPFQWKTQHTEWRDSRRATAPATNNCRLPTEPTLRSSYGNSASGTAEFKYDVVVVIQTANQMIVHLERNPELREQVLQTSKPLRLIRSTHVPASTHRLASARWMALPGGLPGLASPCCRGCGECSRERTASGCPERDHLCNDPDTSSHCKCFLGSLEATDDTAASCLRCRGS